MIFEVVTIFPEMFRSVLSASVLGRAIESGRIAVHLTDPRDFAEGRHRSVDDTPYGGGAGMVMRPGPLVSAIEAAEKRGPAHKILLCPSGTPLTQAKVRMLASRARVLLVCGRYEGFDERVRAFVDEEISIGDYVLTGGELGAMVLIDALARLCEGVLGNQASASDESFESGLLEYPQYTRPVVFRERAVPAILLSGDHARIRRWRRLEALLRTQSRRPDLFSELLLTDEDHALLNGEEP
jgi:tRNA (guanine37-N1)-methyltransferase